MNEGAPDQSEKGMERSVERVLQEHSEALKMRSAESKETRHTLSLLAIAVLGILTGSEWQKGKTQSGEVAN